MLLLITSPTALAIISVALPAVNAMTKRIGFVGYACAKAFDVNKPKIDIQVI